MTVEESHLETGKCKQVWVFSCYMTSGYYSHRKWDSLSQLEGMMIFCQIIKTCMLEIIVQTVYFSAGFNELLDNLSLEYDAAISPEVWTELNQ